MPASPDKEALSVSVSVYTKSKSDLVSYHDAWHAKICKAETEVYCLNNDFLPVLFKPLWQQFHSCRLLACSLRQGWLVQVVTCIKFP